MNASSSTGSKWRARCSRIICIASSIGERLAVDAVAGERVEDVGDRHDPPLDRDRLALQAARVAGAVPLLLMAEGDRRGHVEDRRGRAAHEAVTLLGVRLDDRALLGRQRPGLQQDRVGDRHLADVVQRRGVPEALAELGVHADVFGEQHREAPDPLDVRAGVLVAELDRHRQALNRLGLRDLELGQRAFELAACGARSRPRARPSRSRRSASRARSPRSASTTRQAATSSGRAGDDRAGGTRRRRAAPSGSSASAEPALGACALRRGGGAPASLLALRRAYACAAPSPTIRSPCSAAR